jgi:hypothetical protein
MKIKIALIPVLIILGLSPILAQIQKNTIQASTFFGFNKTSNERGYSINFSGFGDQEISDVTKYEIGLNSGWFVTKHIVIGLGFFRSLENTTSKRTENYGSVWDYSFVYKSDYGVNNFGFIARFYTWPLKKFAIFIEPSYYFGYGRYVENSRSERVNSLNNNIFIENEFQYDVFRHSVFVSPGFTYLLKSWIAIELRLGRFGFEMEEIELTDLIMESNDPYYDPVLIDKVTSQSQNIFGSLKIDSFHLGISFLINNSKVNSPEN